VFSKDYKRRKNYSNKLGEEKFIKYSIVKNRIDQVGDYLDIF